MFNSSREAFFFFFFYSLSSPRVIFYFNASTMFFYPNNSNRYTSKSFCTCKIIRNSITYNVKYRCPEGSDSIESPPPPRYFHCTLQWGAQKFSTGQGVINNNTLSWIMGMKLSMEHSRVSPPPRRLSCFLL